MVKEWTHKGLLHQEKYGANISLSDQYFFPKERVNFPSHLAAWTISFLHMKTPRNHCFSLNQGREKSTETRVSRPRYGKPPRDMDELCCDSFMSELTKGTLRPESWPIYMFFFLSWIDWVSAVVAATRTGEEDGYSSEYCHRIKIFKD